jgi:hypothetical protein
MPKRIDKVLEKETIKISLSVEMIKAVEEARMAGIHNEEARSTFLGYLVKLGLAKYNKVILPAEQGNDEAAANGASAEVSADAIKTKGFKSSVKT